MPNRELEDKRDGDRATYVDALLCAYGQYYESINKEEDDPDDFLGDHVDIRSGYLHCRAFRRVVDVEGRLRTVPHEKIPNVGSLDVGKSSHSKHSTPGGDWHEFWYYFDKPNICELVDNELDCREMTDKEIKSKEGLYE